jgi:hypothetical protein
MSAVAHIAREKRRKTDPMPGSDNETIQERSVEEKEDDVIQ